MHFLTVLNCLNILTEEVCQVDNCVKCSNSNTKCDECQTDYVATEDGLCSVKEETPSEKGGGGSTTTGDEGSLGLSDFKIAGLFVCPVHAAKQHLVILLFLIFQR